MTPETDVVSTCVVGGLAKLTALQDHYSGILLSVVIAKRRNNSVDL